MRWGRGLRVHRCGSCPWARPLLVENSREMITGWKKRVNAMQNSPSITWWIENVVNRRAGLAQGLPPAEVTAGGKPQCRSLNGNTLKSIYNPLVLSEGIAERARSRRTHLDGDFVFRLRAARSAATKC